MQPQDYDVVLVDEAQFFAPVWFEIVQTLVRPQSGHLFLAADPTQGFLRQGVSWKSLGPGSARAFTPFETKLPHHAGDFGFCHPFLPGARA